MPTHWKRELRNDGARRLAFVYAAWLGAAGCGATEEPTQVVRAALSTTCGPPANLQVVVYRDYAFTGPCAFLNAGDWYSGGVTVIPGGKIGSIWTGGGVRAFVPPLPWNSIFEGDSAAHLGVATDTIRVEANDGHRVAAWYVGDYPKDRNNYWTWKATVGPQGLAHDANDWYLTRTDSIFRVPLTADLAADNPTTQTVALPDATWPPSFITFTNNYNYHHYGDPHVYGNYLFVPVESASSNTAPALYVFRRSDLALVRIALLSQSTKDSAGNYHSAFVTIDSHGVLFTANVNLGATGPSSGGLDRYAVNLANIESTSPFLSNLSPMPVYDIGGGQLLSLQTMQGGTFAGDDSVLYLSSSGGDSKGVWALQLDASRTVAVAQNYSENGRNFTYAIGAFQEAEGMDYVDVTGFPSATNLPPSQLHVLLFSNFSAGYWLKHYSERSSSNRALNRPATQSTTLAGAAASRAVDGNPDGAFWDGSVSHTDATSTFSYWRVDLGGLRTIDQIFVFNRTDCCANRLQEWGVWVSDDDKAYTQVFRDSTPAGAGILTSLYPSMSVYSSSNAGALAWPWAGRYVKVQINRTNEYLQLAEVVVDGM
jgi:hypothetical protein